MAHRYKIRVEGHFDHCWRHWLGDLALRHHPDGTTMLTGWIKDQAALHGLLRKLYDMNLPLLSVHRLEPPPAEVGPSPPEACSKNSK